MGLKIIGAGYGRTGTYSMKLALERLGFGPCYHMKEVLTNPEAPQQWNKAAHGEHIDWDKVFSGYQSGVDWPLCHFWKPLSERYTDAFVLLTVRNAEDWYESMTNTIFRHLTTPMPDMEPMKTWAKMVRKIVVTETFGDRIEDKDHVIRVFKRNIEEVKSNVHKDRLIVHEISNGWEPLCTALNVATPSAPFPLTNTTADFQANLAKL